MTAVKGVDSVESNLKAETLTVTPKKGEAPSAKALWEAVEKAGFTPKKLEGPGGSYTDKPKP